MRFSRLLAAAIMAGALAVSTGCSATPPPVSDKVAKYYEDNKTPEPSPKAVKATQPVAAFIGDSYTQGTGASVGNNWVKLVASAVGISDLNLGRGGTGYVAVAGMSGCGLEKCPAYPDMVAQAVASKPSIVVVAGGQNDFINFSRDPEGEVAAVRKTYTDIRTALPDAKIVAVGPSTPWEITPDVVEFDKVIQEAAASVKAKYVSLIQPNVITKAMILQDGAHVNDAGHKAIAERVTAALR